MRNSHLRRTWSDLARGLVASALLVPALLAFGAGPADADWLVLRDGTAVETDGAWEVRGRLVVFTLPDGRLSSMRLSELDLEASEARTEAAEQAHEEAARPSEPAPAREARVVLTDADFPKAPPPLPDDEGDGETEGEEGAAASAAPTGGSSQVTVTSWEEQPNTEEGTVEITGNVRNNGPNPATRTTLNVLVYSDSGTLVGRTEARLDQPVLQPGESTSFIATFPFGTSFSAVRFDVQSRGFQVQPDRPDGGEEEEGGDGEDAGDVG